jgi:hypothetical protein
MPDTSASGATKDHLCHWHNRYLFQFPFSSSQFFSPAPTIYSHPAASPSHQVHAGEEGRDYDVREATKAASTKDKAGWVSEDEWEAILIRQKYATVEHQGWLMHVKCIHDLCSLLDYIPSYLIVL